MRLALLFACLGNNLQSNQLSRCNIVQLQTFFSSLCPFNVFLLYGLVSVKNNVYSVTVHTFFTHHSVQISSHISKGGYSVFLICRHVVRIDDKLIPLTKKHSNLTTKITYQEKNYLKMSCSRLEMYL